MQAKSSDWRSYEVLTVKQAREALRVSLRAVYNLIESGALPSFRVGRTIRIRASDIAGIIDGRKVA